MSDLNDRARAAAETLFGRSPASGVARFLDVNLRKAQYWVKGQEQPPAELVERLEAAAALKTRIAPDASLTRLVEEWRAAGLDDVIIAAAIAAAHDDVAGRRIG